MNDFCSHCSSYLAQEAACPHCGRPRAPAPVAAVTVLGSALIDGEVQPGGVCVGNVLVAPVIAREGGQGQRFGRLLALDLDSLQEVWRRDFPHDLINPPLVAQEGRIFCATQTGDPLSMHASLHALDAATGVEVWQWAPDMRALSAPALAAGRLWLVGDANTLWAVDAASGAGREVLTLSEPRHIHPPAIAGDLLLIPTRGPALLAVAMDTATVRWRYVYTPGAEASAPWSSTPLVIGGLAAAPFSDGSLVLLEGASGAVRWQRPAVSRQAPPLASDGQRLFVGGPRGLAALDLATGAEVWQLPSERRVSAPPLLYQNSLIVAGQDHTVTSLHPATGAAQWRWQGERRFEQAPIPCPRGLILLDGGETLTLLTPPQPDAALPTQEWRHAASQLARAGKLAEAATLLEAQGDLIAAADVWAAAGQPPRALLLYMQADSEAGWEKAAALSEAEGDWVQRAEALKQLAELRDDVSAWQEARQAYTVAGMAPEAAACWRELCRLQRYPFVRIEVQPEAGFVLDQYTVLRLLVRNEGWGMAAALSARASSDAFAGQDMQSQMMGNLAPGRSCELRLGLAPTRAGQAPLTLEVSFLLGLRGDPHTVTRREFVAVAAAARDQQSSQALAQQLTHGFGVVEPADFRLPRSQEERLRRHLALLQDRQTRLELERAEQGVLAGVLAKIEMDRLIEQTQAEIKEIEAQLDALHEAAAGA